MKVKLNADWLANNPKGKLLWIKKVHHEFGFSYIDSKVLSEFLWDKTSNLQNGFDVIVDVDQFNGLKDYKFLDHESDVWISEKKSIHHFHSEEDKKKLVNQSNPFLEQQENLDKQIQDLMSFIPETYHEEAKVVLENVLKIHGSLFRPYAIA